MPAYSADGGFTGSAKGTATKGTSAAGSTKSYNAVTKASSPSRSYSSVNSAQAASKGKSGMSGTGTTSTGRTVTTSGGGLSSYTVKQAIGKGKSGVNMTTPSSAGTGKTGFSPTQPSLMSRISSALVGGTPRGPVNMLGEGIGIPKTVGPAPGISQLASLQKLTAPYSAGMGAIVAGGATPAMEGDFAKTWGFNQEMYSNPVAAASGMVGNTVKAPDKLITDRVAPKAITDRMQQGPTPVATSPRSSTTMAQAQADDTEATALANALNVRAYGGDIGGFRASPTTAPARAAYSGDIGGFRSAPKASYSGDIGGFRTAPPSAATIGDIGVRRSITPMQPTMKKDQSRVPAVSNLVRPGVVAPNGPALAGVPEYPFKANRPYALSDNTFNGSPTPARTIVASNDTSIYGDTPDKPTYQKIADALTGGIGKRTAGARKLGDKINRAMGGSDYNDLYGTASQRNPNARDPMNSSGDKFQKLVQAAQSGDKTAQDTLKVIAPWFVWNQWAPGSQPGLI